MIVLGTVRPLFEWVDVYGQWFCVNVVYKYERFCLPLAAWLLLVSCMKGTTGQPFGRSLKKGLLSMVSYVRDSIWRTVFVLLSALVVAYLLLYRMHWYSWIAWPIMVFTFGFLLSRPWWYRIINGLLHPIGSSRLLHGRVRRIGRSSGQKGGEVWTKVRMYGRDPSSLAKDLRGGAGKLHLRKKRTWLVGVAMVAGIWVLWHNLGFFFDLAAVMAIIAICLAAWLLARIGNCEREFDGYVRSDPRMRQYLDAVRLISAKGRPPLGASLCSSRLNDPDLPAPGVNLWTTLFRISVVPPVRKILRLLTCRKWMPTIDSAFVIQRVERARQEVWHEYASARYGWVDGQPTEDPLAAYLKKVDEFRGPP
jgi:hypothetical protein